MCVVMAAEPPAELPDPPKLPFRRLRHALEQVVSIAIPQHIQILNGHSTRMHELQRQVKKLKLTSERLQLSSEQVKESEQIKFSLRQLIATELNLKQPGLSSEPLAESELCSEQIKLSLRQLIASEMSSGQLESSSDQLRDSELNSKQLKLRPTQLELSADQLGESELRLEQLRAAVTVRRLKQDLFELENLHRQVREEDQDLFCGTIRESLRDAIDMLSAFMQLHSNVMDNVDL